MNLNWLDAVLLVILLVTFILGLIKGLLRQVMGLLAVGLGVIIASRHYPWLSWKLHRYLSSDFWRNCLSFLLIFFAIILIGWLLAFILGQLMKGPLNSANHIFGGIFGLLKGILICSVIVFAMLVFDFQRQALIGSALAPACLRVSKTLTVLIPKDLKDRFNETWKKFEGKGGWNEQKI
jgi:membrane protein required for colicin V production